MATSTILNTLFANFSNPFSTLPVKGKTCKNTVIVTNEKNLIYIVRISDKKQIKSWSSKQSFQFTCPTVFNPVENEYSVVQNGTILRKWTFDEDNFENVSKIKFKEIIYSLIELDDTEPIVVFNKGECQFLQHAISSKKDDKVNYIQDDDIYWVDGISEKAKVYIVLLSINKDHTTRTLHWMVMPKTKNASLIQQSVILKKENFQPLTWCLHQDKKQLRFLLLWSDGELHSYEYGSNDSKKLHSFNLVENLSIILCPLNTNHIALLSASKTQEFEDPFVEIWDFKFSIAKEKKVVHILKEDIQMAYLHKHLFIFDGKNLYSMECDIKSNVLTSLLAISSHSIKMNEDKTVVNWNDDKTLTNKNDEKIVVNWNANEEELMDLDTYNKEESKNDKNTCISQLKLTDDKFSKICEEILLEPKSNIKMLTDCMNYWKQIPEGEMKKLLQFCLSVNDDYFKNNFKSDVNQTDTDLCPYCPERAMFLNKLLNIPISNKFLQSYLLSVQFQDILNLLQYLLYLLKLEHRSETTSEHPSFDVILQWLSLLIDTHFTNFILCKDPQTYKVLSDISDMIKVAIDDFKDMDNLELLLKMACTPEEEYSEEMNTSCKYCIEILYI
ncbi:nucleolar protein 11-like isoform X2 [Centruroides sculpturatus]|uniref:nucleolar protein 11-like isoform X1 n=1 Tax=Centruroides sculpturatus TaxID=218467 RepID=UPI000C6E063A|nr:nucleolar protein 11-like isoform X1 [Centruroides sculpturatus]XP_023243776.1 nucleolar protein 11-like isoform X2 [Centruroides sculpturatus]